MQWVGASYFQTGEEAFQKGEMMLQFMLPHHHGDVHQSEKLYEELSKAENFKVASEFFKLLSDSTRIRIFWLLSHKEECVINIAAMLGMSSPAVSHHLRALTDSGLIVSHRDGKEVYYRGADLGEAKLLHEILEQVMEIACPENAVTTDVSPEETVRKVHAYLMEHISERITIEELSRKFLMNTTTLKQEFKKVYGTSLAAHMKEHRMELAAKALRETGDSIASIALSVGYESQSRFSTAFKEVYEMLPTEYRKQGNIIQ